MANIPDLPELPAIPKTDNEYVSACPALGELYDKVTSAAGRLVDSIIGTIPPDPTSGTAGGIAAKISAAVSAVKGEAEELMAKAKGAVAEINQTLQDLATDIQNKINGLEAQIDQWQIELETAVGEARDKLLAQIAEAQNSITESIQELADKIPSWLKKSPQELLNDVISGICDPEVKDLGVPEEGTAKTMVPSQPPTENPADTPVEVFVPPARPPFIPNPLYIDPETGVTP
ncbi:hypothetical protein [Pseudomonas phage Astolliot]|nr:hypothetical protein [Pseudomonas phage Astolliot]